MIHASHGFFTLMAFPYLGNGKGVHSGVQL